MTSSMSLALQERHLAELKDRLLQDGRERAAYVLCGEAIIQSDPWTSLPRQKYMSFEVLPIPDEEIVSHSSQHITWKTDSFVRALKLAQLKGMTVAIIHSHPGGWAIADCFRSWYRRENLSILDRRARVPRCPEVLRCHL